MTSPANLALLIFGWGNPSRGDDALGPLFVEQLRARLGAQSGAHVVWLDDFQLQVEHALDLVGRQQVLFVDASHSAVAPFEVSLLTAEPERGTSTHSMSPQGVMQVYRDLHHADPPPCTLLAIRGEQFELGLPLSTAAQHHLTQALDWAQVWLLAVLQSSEAGELMHAGTTRQGSPGPQ